MGHDQKPKKSKSDEFVNRQSDDRLKVKSSELTFSSEEKLSREYSSDNDYTDSFQKIGEHEPNIIESINKS